MLTRSQSHRLICSYLLTAASLVRLCYATCYTPNGTDRNAQDGATYEYEFYGPCNEEAAVSMCCRLGGGANTCLSNGICFQSSGNQYWRESCTDPTWTDPACVKLFLNGTQGSDATFADAQVWPCQDGSYCDNDQGTGPDCCLAGGGFFIGVNGEQTKTNPNASSTTASKTTSSITKTGGSATATAKSTQSAVASGSKHTSVLGIGLGVGLGVAALLAGIAVLFFILKARRKRRTEQASGQHVDQKPLEKFSNPVYQMQDDIPELGGVAHQGTWQHGRPLLKTPGSPVEIA